MVSLSWTGKSQYWKNIVWSYEKKERKKTFSTRAGFIATIYLLSTEDLFEDKV